MQATELKTKVMKGICVQMGRKQTYLIQMSKTASFIHMAIVLKRQVNPFVTADLVFDK